MPLEADAVRRTVFGRTCGARRDLETRALAQTFEVRVLGRSFLATTVTMKSFGRVGTVAQRKTVADRPLQSHWRRHGSRWGRGVGSDGVGSADVASRCRRISVTRRRSRA